MNWTNDRIIDLLVKYGITARHPPELQQRLRRAYAYLDLRRARASAT